MLSLSTSTSRFFRPFTRIGPAQLWSLRRIASSASQENHVDPQYLSALRKHDRAAYAKWRYHNDEEFRQATLRAQQKYHRKPEIREKRNAATHVYHSSPRMQQYLRDLSAHIYRQNLSHRRSQRLLKILSRGRWIREGWTWKLHTPVITPDRVDHHCTACQQHRFLRIWWATKAEPTTYMCNSCFASDFDIMVPEGEHKRLSQIFKSPDLPSPPSAKP